jgi:CRISPR system Cascade subunit CasC
MFIELHAIQNFAPSNLNRDDTGNPKDAEFGGVRRARISSQCIKRAIRTSPVFAETTGVDVGKRTRWLKRLLHATLQEAGKSEDQAEAVAVRFAEAYAQKMDKKEEGKTAILVYVSQEEVRDITQALLDDWEKVAPETEASDKVLGEIAKQVLKDYGITSAPDIALFGRMLAVRPSTKIQDAACQVAHAISTHRVTMEMDFFTAVDDLQERGEETGAGMMGFTGFDSACFYRYARIDWEQLVDNLDGDVDLARRTVKGFLHATVEAVPSGKQNAFAAHNPPSYMLATVRKGSFAWSLVNAFERPVRAQRDSGLVGPSVEKLSAYWQRLVDVYGDGSLLATSVLALDPELPLDGLEDAQAPNQEAWIETLLKALPTKEA